jgi:hypothetical protein
MDTIKYKIHLFKTKQTNGISIFANLINAINLLNEGITISHVDAPYKQIDDTIKSYKIYVDNRTSKSFIIHKSTKVQFPSSESQINITYNGILKILNIEFSIPKFYFQNNVCEIYPNYKYPRYHSQSTDQAKLSKFYYLVIKKLIKEIVYTISNKTLILQPEHFRDIQISRLDLAYNQIFDTKEDSLNYLDAQKQIKIPRVDNQRVVPYNTSIMFNTDNYSFKIYHKGSEFSKKPTKDLIRENETMIKKYGLNKSITDFDEQIKNRSHSYFNSALFKSFNAIHQLQNYADTILRYELRVSQKLMSYLNSKIYQNIQTPIYKKMQNYLRFLFETIEDLNYILTIKHAYHYKGIFYKTKIPSSDLVFYFTENINSFSKNHILKSDNKKEKSLIKKYIKVQKILKYFNETIKINSTNTLRKLYNELLKENNKQFSFFLAPQNERVYNQYNFHTLELTSINNHLQFTPNLIYYSLKYFEKLFNNFQIQKMPTQSQFVKLAMDANKKLDLTERNNKMNINRVKIIAMLLKKGHLDELRTNNICSRSTYYRMKKDLKMLTNSTNINFSDIQINNVENQLDRLFYKQKTEIIRKYPKLNQFVYSKLGF